MRNNVKDITELYPEGSSTGSFVECVCVQPGMFTLDGTLAEAGAYLAGFYSGMSEPGSTEAGREESEQWDNFCQWACNKLVIKGHSWYHLFNALREKYSVEQEAFICLAELCIEYRQSSDRPLK